MVEIRGSYFVRVFFALLNLKNARAGVRCRLKEPFCSVGMQIFFAGSFEICSNLNFGRAHCGFAIDYTQHLQDFARSASRFSRDVGSYHFKAG